MGSVMSSKSRIALVIALVLVGSLLVVPLPDADAAEGPLDGYGYYWTDSSAGDPRVTFDWVDIMSTGNDTYLTGDDTYAGPYDIGFDFRFYGNVYSQFYLSTNGYIMFGSGTDDRSNDYIPSSSSPNNIIAPYWDDLCVDYSSYNDGSIYYETRGSSPNQQMVLEFYEISRWASSYLMTFELILNETGDIWFQYLELSGMTGSSASVGIENVDGSFGCGYSYDSASLYEGLAVRFSKPSVLIGPDQTVSLDPDSTYDYTVTVQNNQGFEDTVEIVNSSYLGWPVEVFDEGMVLLNDTNGDLVPDTGPIPAHGAVDLVVRVHVPAVPSERVEQTYLNASSHADPSYYDLVTLTTRCVPGELTPPYEEYTPDEDSNSYYDLLGVNVSFDALFADDYGVFAYLYSSTWNYIGYASASTPGGPGSVVGSLEFLGEDIYRAGYDGPYNLRVYLQDGNGTIVDYSDTTTGAYLWSEFERPVVIFTGSDSDSGLDTDNDTLFNYLVVSVTVNVSLEGSYRFSADLYTSFSSYITSTTNDTDVLTVGTHSVDLHFSGVDVRDEGENGPYDVYIYVRDVSYVDVNSYSYETSAYVWSEFQTRAAISSPVTDYGANTDANPLFDVLVIEVPVLIIEEGDFRMYGVMYDSMSSYVDEVQVEGYFLEGNMTFYVNFSGMDLRDSGLEGPYTVYLNLYSLDTGYLVDDTTHVTGNYSLDEFQGPPISFEPPHSDYGYDEDSDTFYDYLVVSVQVNVTVADDYYIYGDMYDTSGWSYLTYAENTTYLEIGVHTVELMFDGGPIRSSSDTGAFYVYLYVYDLSWTSWDSETYTTSDYSYDEFETDLMFTPPHSDYGSDTNSNTLYDYLMVEVAVDVAASATYYIYGYLYDSEGYYLTGYSTTVTLGVGSQIVSMYFYGMDISESETDGPYTVELAAYNTAWSTMDTDEYNTTAYSWTEFERIPAVFAPPYSDYGVDINDDTYFDYLVFEIYLDVAVEGEYELDAYLYTPSWSGPIENEDVYQYLTVGTSTIELWFSGVGIRNTGETGNFNLGFDLYSPTGSYMDTDWHTSEYYSWDEFSPPGAEFAPPHSDYGLDTNDDSLFNYIVVEAEINVTVAGTYEVYGEMDDYWGWFIAEASTEEYFGLGLHTVELYFAAWEIYDSYDSGPYYVELYLLMDGDEMDTDTHTTAAYDWDDLQPAPAWLDPPYYDYGLDTNSDMYYDYLVIGVAVETMEADYYIVYIDLYASGWWVSYGQEEVWLDEGSQVVEVLINGWDLSESGLDGPYYASIYFYDYGWGTIDTDSYTTGKYSYYEFQALPAVFESPHDDWGVDLDDDGLFDELVVEASVNVSAAGGYVIEAELYDPWWNQVDAAVVSEGLGLGLQTVEIPFDGWQIRAYGSGGPYHVTMDLMRDDGPWLDYDSHTTDAYSYTEFEDGVPSLLSYWTDSPPTIDGAISEDEWSSGWPVDMVGEDPLNELDAYLAVLNNGTHLFVLYDVVGDTTAEEGDAASISFDTGNDGLATDDEEDQFLVGGTYWVASGEIHFVYDSFWGDWTSHCSPFNELLAGHSGLEGAMGFGNSSRSLEEHRVFEFAIPLDLIGASPGDILGFFAGSENCAGVYDWSDAAQSTWPAYWDTWDMPGLASYGDLVLYSSSPPTTECELTGTEGDDGWYISAVEFSLTAEDEDEGVDGTFYRVDGGAWLNYTDPVVVTGSRTHVLEFYSVDGAGNLETVNTVEIPIDTVEPTTTPVLGGDEGLDGWYVTEVSVTFSATDNSGGSGVDWTRYRVDSGTWRTYTGSPVLLTDGVHELEYYSQDIASNDEAVSSMTVWVDATPPATEASVSGSTVELTTVDAMSGVNATFYRVDGGNWTIYTGEFSVGGSGNHTVEYYSVDDAGNEEEVQTVYVDNSTLTVFGVPWWAILLLIVILGVGISLVVVFGMRKKARMMDPRARIEGGTPPGAAPPQGPPQSPQSGFGSGDGRVPPPGSDEVPPPPG